MDNQQIRELLDRGTIDVIVREDLVKKLHSGKKLRIKLGVDATGADLHIGHMVIFRKLRQFQDLGHQVIFLIGSFTGKIGDPSGRTKTREPLTDQQIQENAKTYIEQLSKVLDIDKLEVVYNGDWLSKLTFVDVVKLASSFTVAQMLERDMFQDRLKKGLPIGLHEFLYPLMQGYDSVELKADLELGGTDQTFNLLAGRIVQKAHGQVEQNIITLPMLEGLDGKLKMSKSYNNYIGINESPDQMYGKTMSIPDELIIKYFELCTDISLIDIQKIKEKLTDGVNPRDLKMQLAREIIKIYHSQEAAILAEEAFIKQFREGKIPTNISKIVLDKSEWLLVDLIVACNFGLSKSEIRRLIEQGGVKIDGRKITQIDDNLVLSAEEKILQIGKRRFVKVCVASPKNS